MIYGDNPQKINERQDALGLKTYAYAPQISAIMQSGNLYVYCVNNPVLYRDANGNSLALPLVVGAAINPFVALGIATVFAIGLIAYANASKPSFTSKAWGATSTPASPLPPDKNNKNNKNKKELQFESDTKSSDKLAREMRERGWTKESVQDVVNNPYMPWKLIP